MFERLESRRLLSVSVNGTVISVAGTEAADVVTVQWGRAAVVIVENGQSHYVPTAGMMLSVDGAGGNDRVTLGDNLGYAEIWVNGGDGRDTLVAGSDRAKLWGDAGNDRLVGGGADDELTGGTGNDIILGGAGADRVFGSEGNDRLSGEDGDDAIDGGGTGGGTSDGNDRLSGGDGADRLNDDAGNDRFDGGAGDDLITSFAGNDVLAGGAGDDWLRDTDGRNAYRGGAGTDTALVAAPSPGPRGGRGAAGTEVVEYSATPHGSVAPTAASIAFAVSPEGITSATVTLTLPEGNYDVVWGTPGPSPDLNTDRLRLDVSLRPVRPSTPGFATTATRTFELWDRAFAAAFEVTAPDGRQLASAPLTPAAPQPAGLRPVGISPRQVDMSVRGAAAGGLEAIVAVRYGDQQGSVTFGQLVREGNEFFVDAAATGTGGEVLEPLENTQRGTFALGALEPGTYRFTVRSRTGVVETMAFEVRRGG